MPTKPAPPSASLPPSLMAVQKIFKFDDFIVYYYAPDGVRYRVTDHVVSLGWEESKDSISRTFSFLFDNDAGVTKHIAAGGVLSLVVRDGNSKWVEWYRGVILTDSDEMSVSSATTSVNTQDPLYILTKSEGSYSFPAGRTATQNVRMLLEKARMPMGKLVDTGKVLPSFSFQGTLADAIMLQFQRTAKLGGPRYIPEFSDGKFWIVKYNATAFNWDLDEYVESISVSTSIEDVATKVILKGSERISVDSVSLTKTGKIKKSSKKITRNRTSVAQANSRLLKAYGVITIEDKVSGSDSTASKLAGAAQKKLADAVSPSVTIDVSLVGAAVTLRRLQRVTFRSKNIETGLGGTYYVSSVSGELSADGPTCRIQLTREPDFAVIQEEPIAPSVGDSATVGSSTGDAPANLVPFILEAAQATGVDPALIAAIMKAESGYRANVVSSAGAKGLMQLMDATARSYGVKNIFDPRQNIMGGAKFLAALLKQFKDVKLVIAAYNAGPGAVQKYNGVPPYKETQAYVPRVMNYYEQFKQKAASSSVIAPGDTDTGSPVPHTRFRIVGRPGQGTHAVSQWQSGNAIDIECPVGTGIYAVYNGKIDTYSFGSLNSSDPRLAGLRVTLNGPGGRRAYYAHLSRLLCRPGQQVEKGQIIGLSGSANGTPHLHFAVQPPENPNSYYRQNS